jgi:FAD synthase
MHDFPEDFYDETLKIVLLGEIRKMTTFKDASMSNEIYST